MVPVFMLPGPIRVDRKVLTTVRCHQDELMKKTTLTTSRVNLHCHVAANRSVSKLTFLLNSR